MHRAGLLTALDVINRAVAAQPREFVTNVNQSGATRSRGRPTVLQHSGDRGAARHPTSDSRNGPAAWLACIVTFWLCACVPVQALFGERSMHSARARQWQFEGAARGLAAVKSGAESVAYLFPPERLLTNHFIEPSPRLRSPAKGVWSAWRVLHSGRPEWTLFLQQNSPTCMGMHCVAMRRPKCISVQTSVQTGSRQCIRLQTSVQT